jgi:AraC family transcriptional regulator
MSFCSPPAPFCGEVVRTREAAGLLLSETRCACDAELTWHIHDQPWFTLLRRGGYTESFAGRTRRAEPMMLAFHPAGESHARRFTQGPAVSFNVTLNSEWLRRLGRGVDPFSDALDFQGGETAALALKLHQEFYQIDGAAILAVEGLTLELLASASRLKQPCESRRPLWLERAWQLVQDCFPNTLSLSDVAAAVGVHPMHLATTFRRFYGCSLGEALRRRRVEFAAGRLACSSDALADIARAAGFADQSHFCNTFKKLMGATPSAFRRAVRAG